MCVCVFVCGGILRVLGISDGWAASATLVENDIVIARAVQPNASAYGVPWQLVHKVLSDSNTAPECVQQVAVAGRFSPTLPERMGHSVRPPGKLYRALLGARRRHAWASYKVEDWFTTEFAEQGFEAARVRMVDAHVALAKGSYVSQPRHRALVVVVEPNTDGLSISVSRGIGQQLDRVWSQKSDASFNDYFSRLFSSVGAEYPRDVAATLSSEGVSEPQLVQFLAQRFSCHGAGVKQRGLGDLYRGASLVEAFQGVDDQTARASIFAHISSVMAGLIAHHIDHNESTDVTLAGAIFGSEDLVRAIGEVTGVSSVWSPPYEGLASLGAAAEVAGLGPEEASVRLVDFSSLTVVEE
jgi:hypothetical protein